MSTTWDDHHRRTATLDEMVQAAEETGHHFKPWRLVPGIWEEFHDPEQILRALYQRWHTTLSGAVEMCVDLGEGDLREEVVTGFRVAVHRHRGIRKILEAHAEDPVVAGLLRREREELAAAAGVGTDRLALPLADMVRVPAQRSGRRWSRRTGASYA